MDLLYDFSSAKVSSDALSSRYKKSVGRNKLWTAVQRDVKKKQNKMEKEAEKVTFLTIHNFSQFNRFNISMFQSTFVMYVDRDRGAGVSLGATDLNSDLKKQRKDEKIGALQDNLEWTIYYKEGLADIVRGRTEKAIGLFDKELSHFNS